ncbi:MAG: hypothetical protein PHY94_08525, partial [Candidatus Omnitrophica bacterium]|nr:hypothetical protein [Candidatus Omnitrophota bacterium]
LFNFWLSRENTKSLPERPEQAEAEHNIIQPSQRPAYYPPVVETTVKPSPSTLKIPGITIVAKQPPQQTTPAPETKIPEAKKPENAPLWPAKNSTTPQEASAPNQPAAGLTRIGKYPSETEKKEMNQQGIVMY